MKKSVAIVVPTIREESIKRFLKEWEKEFFENEEFDLSLLIIEDNSKQTFSLVKRRNIYHYSWNEIDRDLRENSWIIPRKTDCIRSYGFLKAWEMKPNFIITLDDDCYPYGKSGFLRKHWDRLNVGVDVEEPRWVTTISGGIRPRGIPYIKNAKRGKYTNVILNHGLWYNVPDVDAKTQLNMRITTGLTGYAINQVIPKNQYFPMSGMNLAWKSEATSALYFLLMGENSNGRQWGVHRFGDIWTGIIFKKIADHLGLQISSGDPVIWHDRASSPRINLKKEATGMKANEYFWETIDSIKLESNNLKSCYCEVAKKLLLEGNYWTKLTEAMQIWSELF